MTLRNRIKALESRIKPAWPPKVSEDTRLWQYATYMSYYHLFDDGEELLKNPDYQEFLELYERHKAGDDVPIPKFVRDSYQAIIDEREAWIKELGHTPTPLELLARYKPFFDSFREDPE